MSEGDTRDRLAQALLNNAMFGDRFGAMQPPAENAGNLQDALQRKAADMQVQARMRAMQQHLREPELPPVVLGDPQALPLVDPSIPQRLRRLAP